MEIKTESDYELALLNIDYLWDLDMNEEELNEFDGLIDAVVEYENIHYPIGDEGLTN